VCVCADCASGESVTGLHCTSGLSTALKIGTGNKRIICASVRSGWSHPSFDEEPLQFLMSSAEFHGKS
jgi:hypothetical protein